MELYGYSFACESDLQHHGIKGQKWGVRRFQNEDGTWTAAGKERYGDSDEGSRSVAGTARRALAKVYDINERHYSKRGNETMASMNKAAKEQMLAKAQAADKASAEKRAQKKADRESQKIAKVEKSIGKFESKVQKENASTLAAREKNRAKLEKKNASADKLKNFDDGTKYVKAGQKRVSSIVDSYKSMQISAIKDSSVKKSAEYKKAVREFNNVARSGISMSTLAYAMEEAANDK